LLKIAYFPTPLSFGVLAPLEFRAKLTAKKRYGDSGESCMILTSTVFDWSTRDDGQTDRRTDRR